MKVIHLDSNHDILAQRLAAAGFKNDFDYTSSKNEILKKIDQYEGIIIRSRFPLDSSFLKAATSLKFIGRVGAGLENIDLNTAKDLNINCYNVPEGNMNAVGEHALGMLLTLLNKLNIADQQVRSGIWDREGNRGLELEGKTVGIIGYGNMGRSFARKLSGFDCNVICHDIIPDKGDQFATQVSLENLQKAADVVSLHTPQTPLTIGMINSSFLQKMSKPFFLINTARGKSVVTSDLITGLESGKVLGAALDVLEQEKSSFGLSFRESGDKKNPIQQLMEYQQVLLTPHVAGWSVESKFKLANILVDKILNDFKI